MKLELYLIYLNYLVIISSIEIQLNVQQNDTNYNYTVINGTNSKNEYFKTEKLFFSNCKCNYNNDVFIIRPKTNLLNFTINTTSNNGKELKIEEPNLFINSKNIKAEYTINNISDEIYKLQINTICKIRNKDFSNEIVLDKSIKKNGIYKVENYSYKNHPEFNDNSNFAFFNFTFNYNNSLYYFSFVKMCSYDELWKEILTCCFVMLIAFIYIYLSTYMKIQFKVFKEFEKMAEIKWYHIVLGVLGGSAALISIYLYKNYIYIFINVIICFDSFICIYYTVLFFLSELFKQLFSTIKYKEFNRKKLLFGINIFEIISGIISLIIVISYFITRNWILNDLICFCLSFTILSFIIFKSFILCFISLFLYFIYDTFWVFYSEKIFNDNIMEVAATSIQIPNKIELPNFFSNNPINNCMLLGLGDIILPGVIIKYCRRFDLIKNKIDSTFRGWSFYKYNLFLYFISVAIAMIMMFGFDHSQPVLFYISPIFIVGLMGKACYDKCFYDFWKGLKLKSKKKVKDKLNDEKNKNKEIDKDKNKKQDKKEVEEEEEEEEDEEDDDDELIEENKKKKDEKVKQE